VSYNKATKKFDLRSVYHAAESQLPDGQTVRRITMDEEDRGKVPTILQRDRKRHKLPPLSVDQLAEEAVKAAGESSLVVNPTIEFKIRVDTSFLGHALLKIAYEVGFRWFGDDLLKDHFTGTVRQAILSDDPAAMRRMQGMVGSAGDIPFSQLWAHDRNSHIAFSMNSGTALFVGIRVFDIYAAYAKLSEDSGLNLQNSNPLEAHRFLSINPRTGEKRECSLDREIMNLARRSASQTWLLL
jgi:hypothetical protein